MLVYLTDVRGERVVIIQVNWIGSTEARQPRLGRPLRRNQPHAHRDGGQSPVYSPAGDGRHDQRTPTKAAAAMRSLPSSHNEGCCLPFTVMP